MKKAAKLCAFVLAGVITFGGLTACTEQNNDVVNNITLSISTTKNEIKVGETLEISVETNGDKTKVVFNSSDTSVCSVTDGVITGLKEGTAQISATLDNVTSNIINIKVTKDNEDPDVPGTPEEPTDGSEGSDGSDSSEEGNNEDKPEKPDEGDENTDPTPGEPTI